jgi:PilZ domain
MAWKPGEAVYDIIPMSSRIIYESNSMTSARNERRSHQRHDYPNRIAYVLSRGHDCDLFNGVTVNMSDTGLCFATFTPVKKHDTVVIVNSMLPINGDRGIVCWTRKMESNVYRVGLKFTGK